MSKYIKRWICGILVLGFVLNGVFPVNASISAERSDGRAGGFVYRYDDYNRVEITEYVGEASSAVVPDTVRGRKVVDVKIEARAKSLKTITISKNVFRCTLKGAKALENVRVVRTNPYICAQNNYVLTKDKKTLLTVPGAREIMDKIPDSVTLINDMSCNGSKLVKVVLGRNIKEIGVHAFRDCNSLQTVTVNGKLRYIGNSAFAGCTGLKKINLRKNVQVVGSHAFDRSGLEKAVVRNPKCIIETEAFPIETVIYGYRGSTAEKYARLYGNRFVELD